MSKRLELPIALWIVLFILGVLLPVFGSSFYSSLSVNGSF